MAKKRQSKRMTLHKKHKIEKKVREHHRKVRKANNRKLRATGGVGVVKLRKKDPGIPNSFPFKMELMQELEKKKEEAKEKKKELRRLKKERGGKEVGELEQLVEDAQKRGADFARKDNDEEIPTLVEDAGVAREGSRKAFMKEFNKVVDAADVILEVLDARDPLGCRCREAERKILAASGGRKRIVLVLNKVDMVPKEVTSKWLAYLRNEFPTIAFRSSTQGGARLAQADISALAAQSLGTTDCLGAANLLSLLKNYSRSKNLKTAICVGVIGYPNVGKSSLINSLKRSRAVTVGSTPGVTRSLQEVHLDKNIRLIDCPGIVFSRTGADSLVLRNCVKIEQLDDVIGPVETILKRVGAEPLMVAYCLPEFANVTEFLALIAKLRGKIKPGGAYDVEAAARAVLGDWNGGKIPFYTIPPRGPRKAHLSADIVSQWGREFDVRNVIKAEQKMLNSAQDLDAKTRANTVRLEGKESMADEGFESLGEEEVMDMDVEEEEDNGKEKQSNGEDGTKPSYHVMKPGGAKRDKMMV